LLTVISIITFLLFGILYPLFLWVIDLKNIGHGFFRFNLGLAVVISSISVIFLWLIEMPLNTRIASSLWLLSSLTVLWFYWDRKNINLWVLSVPSVFGALVYRQVTSDLISSQLPLLGASLLGGSIVCGALFSMILGHWYLNVVNLPIKLLKKSVQFLLIAILIRILWDIGTIVGGTVEVGNEIVSIQHFIFSINGIFLVVGIMFGIILPIILCFMTLKTIAIHSTQSATGLLYVIVISILMGDLFFKYYYLQYGLFL